MLKNYLMIALRNLRRHPGYNQRCDGRVSLSAGSGLSRFTICTA